MNQQIHPMTVAFIQSRWHADIVDQSRISFIAEMDEKTRGTATIQVIDVPGAYEIPLLAKRLAETGNFHAIVGAAFVVDGGIYRHDFVASAVVSGMMQVQLETGVPILSVSLTPHQFQETAEHRGFFMEHFKVKGKEAAHACTSILAQHRRLAAA